ncbi:MAG: hypothetical protein KC591_06935 [Gemmatimonadetes bacterium]|nr:hypothetical protein [Gemmatimonadota bacterium]
MRIRSFAFVVLASALAAGGCERPAPSRPATPPVAPARVVPHSYLPRPVEQDYVEVVPIETHAPIVLMLEPRVQTPREGPWRITLGNPSGEPAATFPSERVDPATGRVTLLVEPGLLTPGEWTVEFDLVPGGQSLGAKRHVFRFRAEASAESR